MALVGTRRNTALSSVCLLEAIAISCNSLAIRPLVFQPPDAKSPETWESESISQRPETCFEMLSGRCEMLSGRSKMLSGRCEMLSGRCEKLSGRCEKLSGLCEMLSGSCEMLSGSQVLGLFASVI